MAAAQPLFSMIGEGPAPEGVNEAGDWYPETLLLSDAARTIRPGREADRVAWRSSN